MALRDVLPIKSLEHLNLFVEIVGSSSAQTGASGFREKLNNFPQKISTMKHTCFLYYIFSIGRLANKCCLRILQEFVFESIKIRRSFTSCWNSKWVSMSVWPCVCSACEKFVCTQAVTSRYMHYNHTKTDKQLIIDCKIYRFDACPMDRQNVHCPAKETILLLFVLGDGEAHR